MKSLTSVDLFAGGGGASEGIRRATGRGPIVAVNHSLAAITMHAANHPTTKHYCESVYTVDPREAVRNGRKVDLLWASPDCTHHSRAKGGKPRDNKRRDPRGTAPCDSIEPLICTSGLTSAPIVTPERFVHKG